MKSHGLVAVDVAEFEKARDESGHKLGSPVGDNVVWEAMVLEHMLQIQVGGLFSVDLDGGGAKMRHLGKMVQADKNGIATP